MKRTCDSNAACTAARLEVADENGSVESVANLLGGQCFGELSLWMVYERMLACIHSFMMCAKISMHACKNVCVCKYHVFTKKEAVICSEIEVRT